MFQIINEDMVFDRVIIKTKLDITILASLNCVLALQH